MKNALKRGFTLVELLVVVLIIGILSSVALPQYQKAVNKSKVAGYWPVLKNLAEAAQLYELETGNSWPSLSDLDIEAPACKPLQGNSPCSYDVGSGSEGVGASVWLGEISLAVNKDGRFCGDSVSGANCRKYGLQGAQAGGDLTKSGIGEGFWYALDSTSR